MDALDAVRNAHSILRPCKSYSSVFESSVTGATERSSMDDVIKKLTAEQALEVVKRLSEKGVRFEKRCSPRRGTF